MWFASSYNNSNGLKLGWCLEVLCGLNCNSYEGDNAQILRFEAQFTDF